MPLEPPYPSAAQVDSELCQNFATWEKIDKLVVP
jgi:hypothetical protein